MIQCSCGTADCGNRLYVQYGDITMVWETSDPPRPDVGEHQMYVDDEALKQLVRDAVAVLKKRAEVRIFTDLGIGDLLL